jgi:glycosyltransferase involved in cell wall biosynthesis
MKTILITAYAINPYKGSEDGMGWQFVMQAARYHKVIAVTRRNNLPHIHSYIAAHKEVLPHVSNVEFCAVDWPGWLLFWKKGPLLSLVYFYFWQLSVAIRFYSRRKKFEVVHNLNFHNDWTPSFLWLLRRPFVWGPVGHHPPIPAEFLKRVSFRGRMREYMLRGLKWVFWNADPFLRITRKRASHIFCMHEASQRKLGRAAVSSIMPSVATEEPSLVTTEQRDFIVFSAGRFVPLKGFDITLRSFAAFCEMLPQSERSEVKLVLAGSGPMKDTLLRIAAETGITAQVEIKEWMPRTELAAMYARASVFLFPSHEGAGMVVAEAMSYSLPVLCWNNCGPGAFLHPQASTAVPYCTYDQAVDTFAEKLHTLYSNKIILKRERTLATEQYNNHFRWSLRGETLKQVYESVMNSHTFISINTIAHEL